MNKIMAMFTFVLQENKTNIEIILTRVLLAVAGILVLLFTGTSYYFINIIAAAVLLPASYFVQTIVAKLRCSRTTILLAAAVVVCIATRSFLFTAILLCYAVLLIFLQKNPEVNIDSDTVTVKKLFANEVFRWADFNNIVVKDGLLTLDFTDNKLLQLYIDEAKTAVNEAAFNSFCRERLPAAALPGSGK